jgi:hypothetical protein
MIAPVRAYLRDRDGVHMARISEDGAISVSDRMLDIAEAAVPGHDVMLKFGRNSDIDTGSSEVIWDAGGPYTFDNSAQSLEIVSSLANDTAAGTGARTVTVVGLDANRLQRSETVTLNGTTAVAISGTWMRVFRAYVATAGTNEVNVGDISIRIASGGDTRARITALTGQTLMAVYTVPAGRTGYMFRYYASLNTGSPATAAAMDLRLWFRTSTGVRTLKHQQSLMAGAFSHTFAAPLVVAEKTDVFLDAVVSANNSDICGGFEMVLSDN